MPWRIFGRTLKEIKHAILDPLNEPPIWVWLVGTVLGGGAVLTGNRPVLRVQLALAVGLAAVAFGIVTWIEKKVQLDKRIRREKCEED